MKPIPLTLLSISLALSACGPATASTGDSSATAGMGTVVVATVPANYTPPPAGVPPTLTPIPPLSSNLSPTELKYLVLAQFPDLFFCDPDYYPVARANETDLARQKFPDLQANSEEFNAILNQTSLSGLTVFADDQKLLIYREHKKLNALQFTLNGDSYQFQLQVAKTEGQGELVSGLINGQGQITVQQRTASIATCPICLAESTLIETPNGERLVPDLRPGDLVWTLNRVGQRVAVPILAVGKTVVPITHVIVHLQLSDGRSLWASPGHPTVDGRQLGSLQSGDLLDETLIVQIDRLPYTGTATYDLLPAGETGFYWANGILIASTLNK